MQDYLCIYLGVIAVNIITLIIFLLNKKHKNIFKIIFLVEAIIPTVVAFIIDIYNCFTGTEIFGMTIFVYIFFYWPIFFISLVAFLYIVSEQHNNK